MSTHTYYAWYDAMKKCVEVRSKQDSAIRAAGGADYTEIWANNIADAYKVARRLFNREATFDALADEDIEFARDVAGD